MTCNDKKLFLLYFIDLNNIKNTSRREEEQLNMMMVKNVKHDNLMIIQDRFFILAVF